MIAAGANTAYELTAILLHSGTSSNAGHYVAIAKRNGKWFYCDDQKPTNRYWCRELNEDEVNRCQLGANSSGTWTDGFHAVGFVYSQKQ